MVVPQAAAQNTNMSQHLRMIIATFNVEHVLVQAAQSTPGASLSDRSDREVVLGCCLHKGCGNMSGVTIEQRSGLGNVLVATKEFQPREAVVQERPLLHVPQLKPSNPLYKPLQVRPALHTLVAVCHYNLPIVGRQTSCCRRHCCQVWYCCC